MHKFAEAAATATERRREEEEEEEKKVAVCGGDDGGSETAVVMSVGGGKMKRLWKNGLREEEEDPAEEGDCSRNGINVESSSRARDREIHVYRHHHTEHIYWAGGGQKERTEKKYV